MSSVALLVVLPFVGALVALFGKLVRAEPLLSVVSTLPLLGMAALLVMQFPAVLDGAAFTYSLGGWPEPAGIALTLDGFGWLSSALVVLISTMVVFASFSSRRYRSTYFFFLMLLVAGMEVVVLTGDIFTMFVGFEIVAISAYVLIAFDRTDEGLLASLKYLLLSSMGILFFLFGVFLLYRDFGTLSLRIMAEDSATTPVAETTSVHLAVAALCVGIGVRTAFMPFHTWLPEAHAYAPHPVSALLSGVLIKISFFAMLRIVAVFRATYLSDLLLWIGAATAFLAVVWALAQRDAKRLLAYHSISQMGYVLAAFGAASALSITAAFSHAMHHALFKSLLFLVAGMAVQMSGERDLYRIRPIGRRAPLLALGFVVGALSIAGIPPFNGFASKQLISSALDHHPAYALLWITAVGTTASFIKASRLVLWRRPAGPALQTTSVMAARRSNHRVPVPEPASAGVMIHIPVIVLALLCLATGLFARPVSLLLASLLSSTEVGAFPAAAAGSAAGTGTAVAAAAGSIPATFLSGPKLLGALPVLVLGILLFLGSTTGPGIRLAGRIERIMPELRTILLYFVLGLALFAIVAYV